MFPAINAVTGTQNTVTKQSDDKDFPVTSSIFLQTFSRQKHTLPECFSGFIASKTGGLRSLIRLFDYRKWAVWQP